MSRMAVDGLATSPETGPEQPPARPRLALAEPPTATQPGWPRPLEVAQCSLCGVARPLGLLVPDGGQACADIRWYCKDSKSCTERWVAALPSRHAHVAATSGSFFARTAEPPRDEAAAEQPDVLAEAQTTG